MHTHVTSATVTVYEHILPDVDHLIPTCYSIRRPSSDMTHGTSCELYVGMSVRRPVATTHDADATVQKDQQGVRVYLCEERGGRDEVRLSAGKKENEENDSGHSWYFR